MSLLSRTIRTIYAFIVLAAIFSRTLNAHADEYAVTPANVTVSLAAEIHDSAGMASPPSPSVKTTSDTADTAVLDKMVVTASRRQRLLDASQSLSVIKPDEWIGTNKSVADVIAEHPGVQTRRYGGNGSFQTISVRGVKGSEVLVLLDGIPLNSALGGAVDLGKINPLFLQEIDLYKGVVPAAMGGNSIGGAINLKSKQMTDGRHLDIQTELGSYGRQRITLGTTLNSGGTLSIYGTGSYSRSENDFPFLDRNNTILGPADGSGNDPRRDDTVRHVRNNQYRAVDVSLYPSLVLPSVNRKLTGGIFGAHALLHLPAPEGKVNETAHYRENRVIAAVSLQYNNTPDSLFMFMPRLGYSRNDGLTEWTNRDSGFGTSHGGISTYGRSGIIDQSLDFDLELHSRLSECLHLHSLVFMRASDANPVYDRDGTNHGDWHCSNAAGGIALDSRMTFLGCAVSAGGCIKGIHDATEGGRSGISNHVVPAADTVTMLWSAMAGLSYKPAATMMIYLNTARYSDEPSLRERYGGKGAVVPNPELRPETGYASEFGLKWNPHRLYFECTGFFIRALNSIVFDFDGYQIRPVNNAGSRSYGIEWRSEFLLTDGIRPSISGTWQKTSNRQLMYRDNKLPDEPELTMFTGMDLRVLKCLTVSYDAEWKSYYYRDRANTPAFRVPARVANGPPADYHMYHNVQGSWNITKSLECRIAGRNLTLKKPGSPGATIEGGYSWILYPVDEWSLTMRYSF